MFMHCPHVSCIGAYQVFDKMLKWNFWVVLDSNGLPWLNLFIMFWSLVVCFTHFDLAVLSHALHMHHICTSHAHLMHTLAHSSCFAYHSCWISVAYMFSSVNMILGLCLCSLRTLCLFLWTNLDLIKFMFLFCVCALVALCFVSVFADVSY